MFRTSIGMGNQTEPRSIVTPGWAGESPIFSGVGWVQTRGLGPVCF